MGNVVFGIFGKIGHGLKVAGVAIVHLVEVIGYDADVLFIDLVKGALALGFTKEHLLDAVTHAETALKQYIVDQTPGVTAHTIADIQHEFVASSLVQKSGLAPALAHTLTTIVSALYASGSTKLQGLIDAATARLEQQAGLTN